MGLLLGLQGQTCWRQQQSPYQQTLLPAKSAFAAVDQAAVGQCLGLKLFACDLLSHPAAASQATASMRAQPTAYAGYATQWIVATVHGTNLPACLPRVLLRRLQRFYTHLHSYLMAGRFADRLQPWLDAFGPDK